MQFNLKTVNSILGIDESFKAPSRMLELMLDDQKRPEIFRKFLAVSSDLSFDWFHEYFEDEQAERKSKKQDFTPQSIAQILTALAGDDKNDKGKYFELAAGTGGILITQWWKDCLTDPVKLKPKHLENNPGISFFSYDPRLYWYQAEEKSDRAIPFLLFNMAIRGMNGVAIQCDSLSRECKEVYFIRNDTDDVLKFSEVIKMKHTDDLAKMYMIKKWVKDFKE